MKQFLKNRTAREKIILGITVILLAGFILVTFVISPMISEKETLQTELSQNQTLLAYMHAKETELTLLRKQQKPAQFTAPADLLKTIDQAAIGKFSTPVQLSQINAQNVSVHFTQVNFDQMSQWLISLWQQDGIIVTQANITAGETPGMVENSTVVLSTNHL